MKFDRQVRTAGTVTETVWTLRDGDRVAAFAVEQDTAAKTVFFDSPIETRSSLHLGVHVPAENGTHCRVLSGPCAWCNASNGDAVRLMLAWSAADEDDSVIRAALAERLAAHAEASK